METTSASQSAATVRALSWSPLACRSASSRSMRAVRTRSMAEGSAVDCPSSSSKSWSRRASARYANQPSRVLRASARASRASRCSRSWRSSALIWSRAPYLSWVRSSSSCHQQTRTHECRATKTNAKTTEQRRKQQVNERRHTWKTLYAGPPWIRSTSFNARLSKAPWPRSSSHSCCSSCVSAK
jgi:hypothetical protein